MKRLAPIDPTIVSTHIKSLKAETLRKLNDEISKLPANMLTANKALPLATYLQNNIETILGGKPAELRNHIRKIKAKFPWFQQYAYDSPTSRSKKYDADLAQTVQAVRSAFDYDAFSRNKDGWGAYQLVKSFNLRLCPYCNLNHINLYYDTKGKKSSPKKIDMRPPLDHYYPRGRYPYLGISIYNLIPSCHQCNSSVKLQADPLGKFLSHPYNFREDSISFNLDNLLSYQKSVNVNDIKIIVDCKAEPERRHVNFFALPQRYEWYAPEIEDLHKKYLTYIGQSSTLQPVLRDLVLGFDEKEREHRMLGFCLHSLFENLITYVPK